jgi:glycyl-tRNA synthetase
LAKNKPETNLMDKLTALCKRRGIVFPASEIYGGVASTYDYGPYGAPMKDNIARSWMDEMTLRHEDIVSLDSAIILHPKVWETSGHVKEFHDPMVDCRQCKSRYKVEELQYQLHRHYTKVFEDSFKDKAPDESAVWNRFYFEVRDYISPSFNEGELEIDWPSGIGVELKSKSGIKHIGVSDERLSELLEGVINYFIHQETDKLICPNCGRLGFLTNPRKFNLMFRTNIGPVLDENSIAYFRPETAQGIYIDYKTVQETARLKIPFGIAQMGKAFRNEITPGNLIFRTREFEQMEMQFFVRPGETSKWLEYWKGQRWNWYVSLGVNPAKLRWHKHEKLAHYAKEAWDIEYEFPFGWAELEGLHDRGDFDISAHAKATEPDKEPKDSKLAYFDDETREKFIPHIVETSAGLNRTMLMLLCDAYREDEHAGESRVYLALNPKVAPVKAAVFPLVKKDGLYEIARDIYCSIRTRIPSFFDEQGSIGRRYRRMDEIGTPFCFTIDYQTKEDGTVTVRWRDTLVQERVSKDNINGYLKDKLG